MKNQVNYQLNKIIIILNQSMTQLENQINYQSTKKIIKPNQSMTQ